MFEKVVESVHVCVAGGAFGSEIEEWHGTVIVGLAINSVTLMKRRDDTCMDV